MSESEAFAKVLSKVSSEAKEEILGSLKDSLKHADSLISDSEGKAALEVEKILTSALRQSEAEKRRIVGSAEVSARNKHLQLVEDNMNSAFEKALAKLRNDERAHQNSILESLLREAVQLVGSDRVHVSSNEQDRQALIGIAKKISDELGIKMTLDRKSMSCAGGVRVTAEDGSVSYDNTFEARLERAKSTLRRRLAELLSSGT